MFTVVSIIMTALSSILSLGAMPFNLWAYSKRWTDEVSNVLSTAISIISKVNKTSNMQRKIKYMML